MNWINPKTDWNARIAPSGEYIGDRFNASDYNRLKNNLYYLQYLASTLHYPKFNILDMGKDKLVGEYFYADEINKIEENLKKISLATVKINYGDGVVYHDNGPTMHFTELNRLESAMLDIYERLVNQRKGQRTFIWNFGFKAGGI